MSRFLKRVGTVRLKFQFELSVRSLSVPSAPAECAVAIKWVRGPRTASTAAVGGAEGAFSWPGERPLVLNCTLYQDKKTGKVRACVRNRRTPRLVLV